MYRDVASEADRDLHFPTGRRLAEQLGYPAGLLDRLPAQAVNSFAGVGYHLGLTRLLPGERVLDMGSALRPVRASRHTSHPDLGGGADAAQAARGEGSTNTTKTEEVSK
jgi:hypothetical protein